MQGDRQAKAADDYLERVLREAEPVRPTDEAIEEAVAFFAMFESLRDWVKYEAQHAPGCSGAFPPHPCKCGLDRIKERLEDWE